MTKADPIGSAREQIPSCALTDSDLEAQRARFARLAPTTGRIAREQGQLVIEFQPGFDRETLDALLAVERECCPFFTFDLDEAGRRLRVRVQEPGQAPALAVLAEQLGAAPA